MSKTTINGILALLITIFTSILAFQVPAALLNPQSSRVWLYVTTALTLVTGVLRAVVGFLQSDADKLQVTTPAGVTVPVVPTKP